MTSTQATRFSMPYPEHHASCNLPIQKSSCPQPRDDNRSEKPNSRGFVAMLGGFRATGGIANGDEFAQLLKDRQHGDFVSLTQLIVLRKVFGFAWRNTFWVPMFQFELRDMTIRTEIRPILVELAQVLDNWSIATWFIQPNSSLIDRKPVDLLDSDFPGVLDAAHAASFVAF